ncbi:MAG: penicillin-binding transpeptidase domain-containing protein [Planctomycetota bacterium]
MDRDTDVAGAACCHVEAMRDALRQLIPSMFHRRLLLLAVMSLGLMALLAAQTVKLTTGEEHSQRQATLKAHLENAAYTPTSRGKIRDRKGRLLAEDRPGWDVQVSFALLSGNWAYEQASAAARRTMSRQAWRGLTLDQRAELTRQYIEPYLVKTEALKVTLAELGGVSPDAIDERRREVVRWVQTMGADATAKNRRKKYKILTEDQAKKLSWAEVDVPVREEYQPHAVLYDVTPETVSWVDQFIAKAKLEEAEYTAARKQARDDGQPPPPDTREYEAWLEVEPVRVRQRVYPWESRTFEFDRSTLPGPLANPKPLLVTVDGIGRHIIGSLRRVNTSDPHWDVYPFYREDEGSGNLIVDLNGYRDNDLIGRFGVERSMESVLRGRRGQRILHLDTGEETIQPPLAGEEIHLSVDIQLQMRMQAILSQDPAIGLMRSQEWHRSGYPSESKPMTPKPGAALNGAAVVLDIDNGEVIGAVSVPGISLLDLEKRSGEIYGDFENRPTTFRPVAYRYEPGSTNKPLVLAAAITDGVIAPDETIDCSQGHLWPEKPGTFRDWIYRPQQGQDVNFGTLNGIEAIRVSSNVFFGRVAQKFGEQQSYQRVAEWFSLFGFGRRAGVGLQEEVRGALPRPGRRVTEEEAAYMSIGEGAMSATPLQVANAHATLARGGLFIPPTFIQDRSRVGPPREASQLHLSPAARDRALRGMDDSANFRGTDGRDRGTTYRIGFADGSYERVFDVPGVKVMAKSGTADAPPFRRVYDGGEEKPDGSIANPGDWNPKGAILREGYHGWVIALVQPEGEPRPTHAIAVVVEYGGSGGRVAGPIVNQIIRALAIEGYLGQTALEAVSPVVDLGASAKAGR